VATASSVCLCGARPIFVDIEPERWCIDVEQIENEITSRTKAIVPVHLYGRSAEMAAILDIAERYGLAVIEDAAQAHGVHYNNQHVGTLGHAGCFSFHANKLISTGEGGIIVTHSPELAAAMHHLKRHCQSPDHTYWHDQIGFNFSMSNFQAAVGVAQIKRIKHIIARRRELAEWYAQALKDVPGVVLPQFTDQDVCWLYTISLDEDFPASRDQLRSALAGSGIETRPVFVPLPSLPFFNVDSSAFPVAREIAQASLSLPSSADMTIQDVAYIAECVIEVWNDFSE
jgi:perosamine synthetase